MTKERTLPNTATLNSGFLCLCTAFWLTACGSGSGDSGPNYTTPIGQIASVDVSLGDTSPPADGVEATILQQNAARNAAAGINVNLVGVQSLSSNASTFSAVATAQPGTLLNDALSAGEAGNNKSLFSDEITQRIGGLQSDPLSALAGVSDDSIAGLDVESERLLLATLGLDASGNAVSTREGNRITIDPDDAAVCEGETFIVDESSTTTSLAQCTELVSHLTVQLDAATEQSGEITYLFNLQPLLVIGYGPRNVMYELKLDVLHQVQMLADQLAGNAATAAVTMRGAVRLVATVDNDSAGGESGTLALAISEPLFIQQSNGERLTLSPSTLFAINHDESAGTASLSLSLGALEFLFQDNDSTTGEIIRIAMGGLTGRFDLSGNGENLLVSDLGLINGPLTLSMGNSSTVSLSMRPLGLSLTESLGELNLNTALDIGVNAQLYDAQQGNASFGVSLKSPAGTIIDTQSASSNTTVKSGGPLQLNYTASTEGYSENGYVSWSPGTCQHSSSNADISLFTCEDTTTIGY